MAGLATRDGARWSSTPPWSTRPPLPSWWPGVVVGVAAGRGGDSRPPDLRRGGARRRASASRPSRRPWPPTRWPSTTLATLLRDADRPVRGRGPAGGVGRVLVAAGGSGVRGLAQPRVPPASEATPAPRVRVERDGDALHVTLTRADARNALDTAMRDQLVDALQLAAARRLDRAGPPARRRPGVLCRRRPRRVRLPTRSRPRPTSCGCSRAPAAPSTRSPTASPPTCTAPAAGRGSSSPPSPAGCVASPDATFGLPEVSLGLIPGAGGTVSLPRRIGRHRTALLALTGEAIDAADRARVGAGRRDRRLRPRCSAGEHVAVEAIDRWRTPRPACA